MAFEALQPAIRFRTEDCIDLPPVTYQRRDCELSGEQMKAMEDMRKHMVAERDGATITAANAAVKLAKLMQLAQGAAYDDEGGTQILGAPGRVQAVKEIVEEADHKVIVWCPFRHSMDYLKQELGGIWKTALINGSTSAKDRAEIITEFQREDSDLKILVAHPATAAHGLTLATASICVWYGPTFSSEMWTQANARIIRPGQKHHMTIIQLGSTTLEWEAYGVAEAKTDRQNKILDLYRKVTEKGA